MLSDLHKPRSRCQGTEVYAAVEMGRRGVGIELKPSYFAQAKKNLAKIGMGQQAVEL